MARGGEGRGRVDDVKGESVRGRDDAGGEVEGKGVPKTRRDVSMLHLAEDGTMTFESVRGAEGEGVHGEVKVKVKGGSVLEDLKPRRDVSMLHLDQDGTMTFSHVDERKCEDVFMCVHVVVTSTHLTHHHHHRRHHQHNNNSQHHHQINLTMIIIISQPRNSPNHRGRNSRQLGHS